MAQVGGAQNTLLTVPRCTAAGQTARAAPKGTRPSLMKESLLVNRLQDSLPTKPMEKTTSELGETDMK